MTADTDEQSKMACDLWDTLLEHLEQGIEYLEEVLAPIASGESDRLSVANLRMATYLSISNQFAAQQLAVLEESVSDDPMASDQLDELLDRRKRLDELMSSH